MILNKCRRKKRVTINFIPLNSTVSYMQFTMIDGFEVITECLSTAEADLDKKILGLFNQKFRCQIRDTHVVMINWKDIFYRFYSVLHTNGAAVSLR